MSNAKMSHVSDCWHSYICEVHIPEFKCATKAAPFHFWLCHGVANGTVFHSVDFAKIIGFSFVFDEFAIFHRTAS